MHRPPTRGFAVHIEETRREALGAAGRGIEAEAALRRDVAEPHARLAGERPSRDRLGDQYARAQYATRPGSWSLVGTVPSTRCRHRTVTADSASRSSPSSPITSHGTRAN